MGVGGLERGELRDGLEGGTGVGRARAASQERGVGQPIVGLVGLRASVGVVDTLGLIGPMPCRVSIYVVNGYAFSPGLSSMVGCLLL